MSDMEIYHELTGSVVEMLSLLIGNVDGRIAAPLASDDS